MSERPSATRYRQLVAAMNAGEFAGLVTISLTMSCGGRSVRPSPYAAEEQWSSDCRS